MSGTAQPSVAAPGDTVEVEGTGWPAGTQVQAVVCGDLAIGGSSACAQESAALGFVNDEGLTQLEVVVAAPPRPCPCVIRLASYNGPVVAVDIPFVVTGHPVGTPPAPILPSALLTVTDVEVQGDTGIGSWFGASPTRQLVITVRNDGDAVAVNPELSVGVGKAVGLEAQPVTIDEFSIDPGETETITVDVSLPFAAFGEYRIVGQVGPRRAAAYWTTWSSYPWGLVALNVIGLLLLAWGISRRVVARHRRTARGAGRRGGVALGATPGLDKPYVLPDVVYVSEVGGFLVSPKMAGRTNLFKRVDGRLELKDLAALGALTAAGTPMLSLPATERRLPPGTRWSTSPPWTRTWPGAAARWPADAGWLRRRRRCSPSARAGVGRPRAGARPDAARRDVRRRALRRKTRSSTWTPSTRGSRGAVNARGADPLPQSRYRISYVPGGFMRSTDVGAGTGRRAGGARRTACALLATLGLLALSVVWAPSASAAPKLTVSATSGLTDGQTIQVSGSGFSPNMKGIAVGQCKVGYAGPSDCNLQGGATFRNADANGSIGTVNLKVTMKFGAIDCSQSTASLRPRHCPARPSAAEIQAQHGDRADHLGWRRAPPAEQTPAKQPPAEQPRPRRLPTPDRGEWTTCRRPAP